MRELGEDGPKFHRDVSKLFTGIDKVLLVGEIWLDADVSELPNCFYFDGWQAAYKFISENNDWAAMLVKGSNSHKLQALVAEIESRI
jgi:UDP-N-acetylmuramyl pentapeptide synthase